MILEKRKRPPKAFRRKANIESISFVSKMPLWNKASSILETTAVVRTLDTEVIEEDK